MAEEYRLKTMETTGPNPSPLYIKNPVISQVPYLQTDLSEPLSVYQTLNPDDSV